MTTEELLNRVEQRLNRTGNPSLPPEETMQAILALDKERETAQNECATLNEKVGSLQTQLDGAVAEKEDAEFKARQAESKAKEAEWVAGEMGKFIRDVANHIYEGQEISAAQRVYDLNKGNLTKKRIRANDFASATAAEEAYRLAYPNDAEIVRKFVDWLFETP